MLNRQSQRHSATAAENAGGAVAGDLSSAAWWRLLPAGIVVAVMAAVCFRNGPQTGLVMPPRSAPTRLTPELAGNRASATVHLYAGDVLVIASLDRSARQHEFRLHTGSETTQGTMIRGIGSHVDVCAVGMPETRADADTVAFDERDEVHSESERPDHGVFLPAPETAPGERLFRLPFFCGPSSAAKDSTTTAAQAVERVVPCRREACFPGAFVYSDGEEIPRPLLQRLGQSFAKAHAVSERDGPGVITDIDQDGCLSLVIACLSDGPIDGGVPLLGCVRAEDIVGDQPLGGDIIYLDHRLLSSDALDAVLVHEMAHASVFSRMRQLGEAGESVVPLEMWLNEAVAHSCEFRQCPGSPNLAERIREYLQTPGRWPLIPPHGYAGGISARGPVRAAGLFYLESQRSQASIRQFVDHALTTAVRFDSDDGSGFADRFRRWTVWMSDQQNAGRLALRVRSLAEHDDDRPVVIRGTAATWWSTSTSTAVTVSASRQSQMQLTIVRSAEAASTADKSEVTLSERLPMAGRLIP